MVAARSRSSPLGALSLRTGRFEDVSAVLGVIARAVERGCRDHYDEAQRRVVVLSYGRHLFVEAVDRFELVAAERAGRLVGAAQLDPADGRLRALFVDGASQGGGVGAALLAEVEARARGRGLERLHGAMSLNAVAFYERQGFRRCPGPTLLAGRIPVPVVPMEKVLPGRHQLRR